MTPQTPKQEIPQNSFTRLIAELRDGEAMNEASQKLHELVQSVVQNVKSGEFTLKLKLRPAGRGKAMSIIDEVSVKMPQPEQDSTLLFATEDGRLQRTDPKQRTLDLRAVPADGSELKEVPTQPKAEPKVVNA